MTGRDGWHKRGTGGAPPGHLTERQRAVLALARRGYTNDGIAAALGVSAQTVKNHLTAVYVAYGLTGAGNPRVLALLRPEPPATPAALPREEI